jgi:hypothetical protein
MLDSSPNLQFAGTKASVVAVRQRLIRHEKVRPSQAAEASIGS